MTKACERCGAEIDTHCNRKFCLDCRRLRYHEISVAEARRKGCRPDNGRKFWNWVYDHLKEEAALMRKEAEAEKQEFGVMI